VGPEQVGAVQSSVSVIFGLNQKFCADLEAALKQE
jgi:hypothetical protein